MSFLSFVIFKNYLAAPPTPDSINIIAIVDENLLIDQNDDGYLASTNNQNGLAATTPDGIITTNKDAGELFVDNEQIGDDILFFTNNY